jgi:large subunit ribosomal protein L29
MAHRIEKFREMDQNELEIRERELGDQIFSLRFQLTTGQAESVKKIREARRDLARVKTLLRAMALAPAKQGASKVESKSSKAEKTDGK